MKIYEIQSNKCQCLRCGELIESKSEHNAVWCGCKSVMADGGKEYIRRLGNEEDILELSEIKVIDVKELFGIDDRTDNLVNYVLKLESDGVELGDFDSISEFYDVVGTDFDEYVRNIGKEIVDSHIAALIELSKYE